MALDMWEPYIGSTREILPRAEVDFDKFHIARHLGEALDRVRRQENKSLRRRGTSSSAPGRLGLPLEP